MAKVAVVVFPGSNCDRDVYTVLRDLLKLDVVYHWHTDPIEKEYRAVVLPGGFSYGDYLRAGALAKISPAVLSLNEFIDTGKPVLGICNGFQILAEAGYLPGALVKNRSLSFQCEDVHVRVESVRSPFLKNLGRKKVLRLPIAHSEGRFVADETTLARLKKNDQIALSYCGPNGEDDDEFNANGSMLAVGGLLNERGNVLGLMPHPERCSETILGNNDGLAIFQSMVQNS